MGNHHCELSENLEGKMLSERFEDATAASHFDWGKKCRNQCISERKERNSTGGSALCEQSARNITYTEEEQRNLMTEERCACDMCGIFFKDPVILKSQQRFHTKERPSRSTDCGKTFSEKREQQQQKSCTRATLFICSENGKVLNKRRKLMQCQKFNKEEKLYISTEYRKRL
ncbi:gastrula zinc finger protein XlCGF7.1-like [Rhinatrema bivittatum]|uniref:gastrula zinc finger protein XlCGF7.1-like n=1 Tax=Rhinatrema bivittatum TaxID=194408 RepID=UPI001126FE88|nr:gastrula zinc finger protein XlCGF7.1-like [Rhinatrema bivittatum]